MAIANLLSLLDDIASLLDDVAAMSKVAVKKTAGVLSDDLALNAQQVSGVRANRELPVVWAVAKGSLLNKLILIPAALLISHFVPWLIEILLIMGGAYLCFEGVEKLLHSFEKWKEKRSNPSGAAHTKEKPALTQQELKTEEKRKISGAIRTDFILSAEIIVIALNVVIKEPLLTQIMVLVTIGFLITAGVYGFVAGIVKLDDMGYWLINRSQGESLKKKLGLLLISAAPYLMKFLSVVGTIAMFLVGGGIIMHNIDALHHLELNVMVWIKSTAEAGAIFSAVTPSILNLVVGLLVGVTVLIAVHLGTHLFGKKL